MRFILTRQEWNHGDTESTENFNLNRQGAKDAKEIKFNQKAEA